MSIKIPVIPFDEQNTDDAAGKKTNKTKKPSYNLDGSKRDKNNPKTYPSGLGTGY